MVFHWIFADRLGWFGLAMANAIETTLLYLWSFVITVSSLCIYSEEANSLVCSRNFGIESVARFPSATAVYLYFEESIMCSYGLKSDHRFNISALFDGPLVSLTIVSASGDCRYEILEVELS